MIDKNLGTSLTAWFDLNNTDHDAKQYLYNEIPSYYVFDKNTWTLYDADIARKIIRVSRDPKRESEMTPHQVLKNFRVFRLMNKLTIV